ncbi:probable disease resistance protein At4g27220 [Pistacia vera]|uniref:probable disease resistance protein At4g27220 n=1 Tax=Pistacia vera TaxID=55513 RepID=UPI00126310D3|nr:probable disease resistance protein At4g27220 [Pistacia vera]
MEETAGNAVLEVGKCLAAPIVRQFMNLYNYKSNFDNLEKEIGKLKDARDEVKDKVVAAENNVEKIKQQVKDWQRNVDSIIDEAEKLIQEKTNSRCFNLITCYKNSRKASKKVEAVTEFLQEKETFNEVSLPTTREDIRLRLTNKDYEEFESRFSTLNGVLNAVADAEAGIIGVYLMGGIGKTTLVKEVGEQAKKKQLLDEVIFVEVSDKPDTKKIQDELANQLSLKFEKEAERASKLYARLKTDKKILVILDNIWEELNLEALGIPCGNDRGGCKVLLTARDLNVLQSMDSVKNFPVGFLTEEEAWSLFKKMAGIVDQTIIKLNYLPNDVCKECRGLPIIITTVARALRNKRHRSQWEDALQQLKMPSPTEFAGLLEKDYSKIALSYNYLKGDELKRTFLVCSLMVNDTTISDLLKYIMGLDILEGVIRTIDQARNRLESLVLELKNSCLLLDGRTNEHFSMHDVVRAVAITIAYRDQHVFTERNNMEREWSNKDELKKCSKISLADTSVISELWPKGLDCPKLEFFSMRMKGSSFKIPEEFFVGMDNLKVLSLLNMKVLSLPSSLSLLINLQTLCLNYGNFADITIIGELSKLEILSLQHCKIEQLPGEIGKLTHLKLLDLSHCRNLQVIAPNVISCLLRLEELYMSGCSILWKVKGLEELNDLSQLTALEIDISDDKVLPEDLFSKKLERYKISIGDWPSRLGKQYINGDDGNYMRIKSFSYDEHATLRKLKLKFSSVIKIWPEQFQCFKNVEFLCLDKLESIKNDVYELDKEGFSQLKHLHVHNNPNIVCIVDSTKCIPCDAFPLLESVILFNLINLKTIFYGQPTTKSFYNLKVIEVQSYAKLLNIFSFSNASKSLPQLQRIRVKDCENMNVIFAVEREDRVNKNEVVDKIEFFQLRFLTLVNLPRIASFYSEANTPSTLQTRQVESSINLQSNEIYFEDELIDTDTPIFNKKVIFPSLEALKLKAINSEKIWDYQLPTISCGYQNLKSLIVHGCQKLKYVFPYSIIKSFEQLQHLEIRYCKELKEIVAKEEGAEATTTFVFPQVAFLKLENLPELTTFYPGKHTSEWPMLKKMEVRNCHRLHIFTSEYKVVIPNLEALELGSVNSEMIWDSQVAKMSHCYQNLARLVVGFKGDYWERSRSKAYIYLSTSNLPTTRRLTRTLSILSWSSYF